MNNSSFQRIKDILNSSEKVGVAVGTNPTVDEMAAALSLYLAVQAMGKSVTIACPTNPIVELSSLVGIDRVRSQFEGEGGDLVVSFPYREGEIEKVSYTIDGGFLNIVVKAGEEGLNFDEQDVRYSRGAETPQLLFVVGTPRLSDLGGLYNEDTLKDTTIINIDNKQDNQGFGDIVLVSPKFSSVSEQIADLLLALGIDFDVDAAQNMLSGISTATNNFQDPSTSYLAFEIAAILMKKGATRGTSFAAAQPQRRDMPQPRQEEQRRPERPQPQLQQPMRRDNRPQHNQPRPQQQQQSRDEAIRQELSAFMQQGQNQQAAQPQQNQPRQPQRQPEPEPESLQTEESDQAPSDWLTPKVYKGSTSV